MLTPLQSAFPATYRRQAIVTANRAAASSDEPLRVRGSDAPEADTLPVRPLVDGDALPHFRSAWTAIVGEQGARASAPTAIRGHALLVTVTSSAWAQQLKFGERSILDRLARVHIAGRDVQRITIRVGVVPPARAVEPTASRAIDTRSAVAQANVSTYTQPPQSAAEALSRFRERVAAVRSAYFAAGGQECERCGGLVNPGVAQCRVCVDTAATARQTACAQLLHVLPTTTAKQAVLQIAGLRPDEYARVRNNRLRSYYDAIVVARAQVEAGTAIDAQKILVAVDAFVALETRLDPAKLGAGSPIRRNVLGDLFEFVVSLQRYAVPQKKVAAYSIPAPAEPLMRAAD